MPPPLQGGTKGGYCYVGCASCWSFDVVFGWALGSITTGGFCRFIQMLASTSTKEQMASVQQEFLPIAAANPGVFSVQKFCFVTKKAFHSHIHNYLFVVSPSSVCPSVLAPRCLPKHVHQQRAKEPLRSPPMLTNSWCQQPIDEANSCITTSF